MAIEDEFDKHKDTYIELTGKALSIVKTLLSEAKIDVHEVSARTKTKVSLLGKLQRKQHAYKSIRDITDITGLRITTYYANDVDKVVAIIANAFRVDKKRSSDKRKTQDPKTFGYMSHHHVVQLSQKMIDEQELAHCADIFFELQTRSILQHAWAEIEHDIGYKPQFSLSYQDTRRFSRLAGLLELVDEEFDSLRKSIILDRKEVIEQIEKNPEKVKLSPESLALFQKTAPLFRDVEKELALATKSNVLDGDPQKDSVRYAALLTHAGVMTIADLTEQMQLQKARISELGVHLIGHRTKIPWVIPGETPVTITKGLSFWYLTYLLVLDRNDHQANEDFIIAMELDKDNFYQYTIPAYQEVMKNPDSRP